MADAVTMRWQAPLGAILGDLKALPPAVEDELVAGVTEATLLLERVVVEKTPTSGAGTLRSSIGALPVVIDGLRVKGAVASASPYVLPVETGSKPHHPPIAPLLDWVHRKLGLTGVEAEEAARRIVWKIAAHGTKGVWMFKQGLAETEEQIAEIITAAAERGLAANKGLLL